MQVKYIMKEIKECSIITIFLLLLVIHVSYRSTLLSQDITQVFNSPAPVNLTPYARIQSTQIKEASGLVKSQLWNDVYWTINDSGNDPLIFPFTRSGQMITPSWDTNVHGIQLYNSINIDWEAITADEDGYLYIADIGNNANVRRDLVIYKIREPYPWETAKTVVFSQFFFYYPEQLEFPASKKNFDAEALFWRKGKLYVLTKNRSDDYTQLYELDPQIIEELQAARLCDQFHIGQPVTDACYHSIKNQLLVLTTKSVWLFEPETNTEKFFTGEIRWLPIKAGQCEAVCFDNENILILNEEGDLFQLPIDHLIPITP